PLAAERLVVGRLHMGGGPRLQYRVLPVAKPHSDLSGTIEVAIVAIGRVRPDRAPHARRRGGPNGAADPAELVAAEVRNLTIPGRLRSRNPGGGHETNSNGGGTSDRPHECRLPCHLRLPSVCERLCFVPLRSRTTWLAGSGTGCD